MANATDGAWGDVIEMGIMGIHQVLLGDGKVLYWGDNGLGSAFSNTQSFAIFDPTTGTHEIVTESFAIRMFCGAGVIIPGTDQVLIAGGNGAGQNDGKIFDASDEELTFNPDLEMDVGRFYPTLLSLPTGQLVIFGGNGGSGVATPEIFTLDEGWRSLTGATDPDVGTNWWYPKAWLSNKGEIIYIAIDGGGGLQNSGVNAAGTFEVMAMDPSGSGSIRQIGEVPFQMDVRSTAVMYDVGKVVIMDNVGDLWIMDINGDTPTFTFAANLPTDRENGDMTVMADGRILLNGGTEVGNSQNDDDAVFQSVIFDPFTGDVSFVDSESVLRTYHSSSLLLADGTIISSGGGGLNGLRDFQDAQIYTPDYLFDDDGSLADRPVISSAPSELIPGQTFVVTVDDASSIARFSFVKTGAVTHSINMESGRMDLDFDVISPTQIEVSLPDNPYVLGAGNWMLFAIDTDGVPSVAPIISVNPTLETFEPPTSGLNAEYFILDTEVTSLNQIDFTQAPDFEEDVSTINFNVGSGAVFDGGPVDDVAARYTGLFEVKASGSHEFFVASDDGAQLFIDGQLLVDNDGVQPTTTENASITLEAGTHSIEVIYFERGGSAVLDVDWAGPGFARRQLLVEEIELSSVETNGDVELAVSDVGDYILIPNGGEAIVLKEGGVPIGPDSFPGFAAIQAEENPAGGYRVLWEGFGRTEYTWDVDATGEFVAEIRRQDIFEVEFLFEADINGDGSVGAPAENPAIDSSDLTDDQGSAVRFDGANLLVGTSVSIVEVDGDAVASPGWQGWKDASNGGQISINTDGRVQFRDNDGDYATLALGQEVTTSLSYKVSDGSTKTVSFTVAGSFEAGPPAPPDAVADTSDPVGTSELRDAGGNVVKIDGPNVLANDTDPNGDPISIITIGGDTVTEDGWQGWRDASNGGQIAMNTDGRVQFRDVDFDFVNLALGASVETSLVYEISDGNGGTDPTSITFVINQDDTTADPEAIFGDDALL
ncbi:MAG: PA14 domain-containing protein [Pseudomonadota bacterium]